MNREPISLAGAFLLVVSLFIYSTDISSFAIASGRDIHLALGQIIERVPQTTSDKNRIVFLGDILLARDVERKMLKQGSEYPFLGIDTLFDGAYVVGNFEASIPTYHESTPDFSTVFSVALDALPTLVKYGFTHFSLANNHTLDFRTEGLLHTQKMLELYGFKTLGNPETITDASVSYIVIDGVTVAIVALNAILSIPEREEWEPIVNNAKEKADLVVVYPHWGSEYQLRHNSTQRQFAHELIDTGVDLIIGHHPHVVQDIERYKEGIIIYSLGNFIFDQYFSKEVQIGLVVSLEPLNEGFDLVLLPVTSIDTKAQPHSMQDEAKQNFLDDLSRRSDPVLREAIIRGQIQL